MLLALVQAVVAPSPVGVQAVVASALVGALELALELALASMLLTRVVL